MTPRFWEKSGTTGSLSTTVRLLGPGSSTYTLIYGLSNGEGTPNSWQAVIGSVDGSFDAIVLDNLVNSPPFDTTYRLLPFIVPDGTLAVTLTFKARQDVTFWWVGTVKIVAGVVPTPPPSPPSPPPPAPPPPRPGG
eukprot:jgi/Botrbrau1/4485/Bobra.0220s0019.1